MTVKVLFNLFREGLTSSIFLHRLVGHQITTPAQTNILLNRFKNWLPIYEYFIPFEWNLWFISTYLLL